MTSKGRLSFSAGSFLCLIVLFGALGAGARAADRLPVLKIGVLGAMTGPARAWGLTSRYCAEVTADMYNDRGGLLVGGIRYRVRVVSADTGFDPEQARQQARHLIEDEGIRYVIGPQTDDTSLAIVPLMESAGVVNVSYGFGRAIYRRPQGSSFLGAAASYQVAPLLYRFLRDHRGIRSIAFVTRDDSESMSQRNVGFAAARRLGLEVRDPDVFSIDQASYRPDLADIDRVLTAYVAQRPDLIVLPGVVPGDAPRIIRRLRELGYHGLIGTETAQDFGLILAMGAGAQNFVAVGGTAAPAARSGYMNEFMERYRRKAGEWHDEAGTKAYALEMVLRTLQQAGSTALHDTRVFKRAVASFGSPDPFTATPRILRYVGRRDFGDPRQIRVPLYVKIVSNGRVEELFSGELPD